MAENKDANKELTIENLAGQFDTLKKENDALMGQLEKKYSAQAAAITEQIKILKEQNGALVEQLQEKSTSLEKALQVNSDLSQKLDGFVNGSITIDEKPQLPKLPADPTFTYGRKKYKLRAPSVNIPGIGHRTAEEILVDAKAQKALVEAQSGIIKEVV